MYLYLNLKFNQQKSCVFLGWKRIRQSYHFRSYHSQWNKKPYNYSTTLHESKRTG